jgi:hypothetical protein
MKKFNVFLPVLFGVNIGINIATGNLAAICGWFAAFIAALIAQIQIIILDQENTNEE